MISSPGGIKEGWALHMVGKSNEESRRLGTTVVLANWILKGRVLFKALKVLNILSILWSCENNRIVPPRPSAART